MEQNIVIMNYTQLLSLEKILLAKQLNSLPELEEPIQGEGIQVTFFTKHVEIILYN